MDGAVTYADVKFVKNPAMAKHRQHGTEARDNSEGLYANIRVPGGDARAESASGSNGCQAFGGYGEITYAEVKVTQTIGDNIPSGSSCTSSKALQLWRTALVAHVTHILMATSLLLLVTTIALGVRYSQNFVQLKETKQHLQRLTQHHETLNDSMYQRIRESDRTLMDTEDRLTETQTQCNQDRESWKQTQQQLQINNGQLTESLHTTRQALRNTENSLREKEKELTQSQNELNQLRSSWDALLDKCRSTESRFKTCTSDLAVAKSRSTTLDSNLYKVKELLRSRETSLIQAEEQLKVERNLISTLCMNKQMRIQHFSVTGTGYFKYCPIGWVLINRKCYFFSEKWDTRDASEKACKSKSTTLAVVISQDSILKDYIKGMSHEYWIGLQKVKNKWTWSDGSPGVAPYGAQGSCAAWGKELISESCSRVLPWICEKEAPECSPWESFKDCFRS
ncbi:hypothetical protein NDU88_000502 [Pleurodeles waltl]|uniref:C-type lectin domain-containing protein n=1 Tax=Pleurodeles waltl TaxID=8319 RepID=A0AAV7WJW0_PLEWA|nr:hypothetical protein NDU88_000502 [Pleurodeles waltl]